MNDETKAHSLAPSFADGIKADPSVDDLKAEIDRLNRQLDNALRSARQAKMLHVLATARDYAFWLVDNGAGSTYSTFCDDFGYQAQPGEDRPALYRKLEAIFDVARAAL